MKQYAAVFCAALFLILGMQSCVNSTSVGGELLGNDQLDLNFTDTVSVKTYTTLGDSVRTFSPILSLQLPQMLVGNYTDPVFGQVKSSIYAQMSINGQAPSFAGATLDSVILVMPYLSDADYGVINSNFDLEVLKLNEDIDVSLALYSNAVYETEVEPIGSISFVPQNADIDSVEIYRPKNDQLGFDTLKTAPHLRVPLTSVFSDALFNADINNYETDSLFKATILKGIEVKASNITEGLVGFNLRTSSGDGDFAISSGIYVYYHTDTTNVFYRFPLSSSDAKLTSYQHDYSGSVVENYINDTSLGDSLFFLQGFEGLDGIIEFPYLDQLGDRILLNKAELVLNIAELPEDSEDFEAIAQLTLAEMKNDDGVFTEIEDVELATVTDQLLNSTLSTVAFGGNLVENADGVGGTYTMNVTAYVQDVLKGDSGSKLRVSVYNKSRFANRSVFYGGGHSEKPVTLKLYYTKY